MIRITMLYKFHLVKNSLLALYKFLCAYIIYTQNIVRYLFDVEQRRFRVCSSDVFYRHFRCFDCFNNTFHAIVSFQIMCMLRKFRNTIKVVGQRVGKKRLFKVNILLVKEMSFVSVLLEILRNTKCKIELKISQLVHSSTKVISNANLNRLRPQQLTSNEIFVHEYPSLSQRIRNHTL